MIDICPKCQYQRRDTDNAPEYECPNCGIVYAKYIALMRAREQVCTQNSSARPPASAQKNRVTPAVPLMQKEQDSETLHLESHNTYSLREFFRALRQQFVMMFKVYQLGAIAVLILGLGVGYFAGREHVKYQLRSAFQDFGENLSKSFAGMGKGSEEKTLPKKRQDSLITATFIDKGWEERSNGNVTTFSVNFENKTGRNVKAYTGRLTFTNLLGQEVIQRRVTVQEPFRDGESFRFHGEVHFNQFLQEDEKFRNEKAENLSTFFQLTRVVYDNGEIQDFEE